MVQRGSFPDVDTYDSLISACEKGHRGADQIEEHFLNFAQSSACEKGHWVEITMRLVHEMDRRKLAEMQQS